MQSQPVSRLLSRTELSNVSPSVTLQSQDQPALLAEQQASHSECLLEDSPDQQLESTGRAFERLFTRLFCRGLLF
ncbi:hypothetical protein EPA93_07840 [Ktedonosporobacter rubrisoli]|uniref:Uncharacterized protein n=1 Tax=Ktedonosporobacter rubrisoli TaxID=2509675 RepID=A0A4P6JL65_KTERU|nr:hypothetical protein [Ktedonosporobacter rubrisoli]QBD75924.1 hypothetical protein EPA93_07840 [Ktedonosporobacter rubrisoli]